MPVDESVLEALMQSTAALNAKRDEWTTTFGFPHICKCDEDYANENMIEAPECWAIMAEDALATCKRLVSVLRGIHESALKAGAVDLAAKIEEFLP